MLWRGAAACGVISSVMKSFQVHLLSKLLLHAMPHQIMTRCLCGRHPCLNRTHVLYTCRPNMEATLKSKKGKKAGAPKKRASPQGKAPSQAQAQSFQEDEVMPDESRYVGCFASESSFLGPSLHPHLPFFLLSSFLEPLSSLPLFILPSLPPTSTSLPPYPLPPSLLLSLY